MLDREWTNFYHENIEQALKEQGIRKIGVALCLIDADTGKIWTVREKIAKPETGRSAGDITIPLETRKYMEHGLDTLVGALEEFRPLNGKEQLYWSIDPQANSYLGAQVLVPGVLADVYALYVRQKAADREIIQPVKSEEVLPNGWMNLVDLLQAPDLRDGVSSLARQLEKSGFIQNRHDILRSKVYRPDFLRQSVVQRALQQRDERADWAIR